MKIFQFAVVACLSFLLPTHGFDTEVRRKLQQIKYEWKIFHFICADTMYICDSSGGAAIPPATQCLPPKSVTKTVTLKNTSKECAKLVNEAKKNNSGTLLHKTSTLICPNLKRVNAYARYDKTGGHGRYCTLLKGCLCCKGADGFGDPHFVTYDGTPYSYHGQCDLVMAQSNEFGNGVGFRVHGRTKIIDGWSLISNAAVQIGNDVLEFTNTGKIYFNGDEVVDETTPMSMAGVYNVTTDVKMVGDIPRKDVFIQLGENNERIKLALFKRLIAVHVGSMTGDIQGMLGNRAVDGLVGRNNALLEDPLEMGTHWQVNDHEPMLFHEVISPQYPEKCILPAVEKRKLRTSANHKRRAEEACSSIQDENMRQFCMEDVLLSGDLDVSMMYGEGH